MERALQPGPLEGLACVAVSWEEALLLLLGVLRTWAVFGRHPPVETFSSVLGVKQREAGTSTSGREGSWR